MKCARCGNENKEGANFCQACGQPLRPYQGPGYANPGYFYPPYQNYQYAYPPQFPERKDAMVGLLLAFLIPGAGHMYAGEMKKGILILASFFIIGGLAVFAWFIKFWSIGSGGNPLWPTPVIILALVILVLIWLYQLYDAYQAAARFNTNLDSKHPY